MIKKIFNVKGMDCAGCSAIITRKVEKLDGVQKVDVNFATEKATVELNRDISEEEINSEIEKLGYSFFSERGDAHKHSDDTLDDSLIDNKIKELLTQKAKAQFMLPISLMVFILMVWDILAQVFTFVPNLPIPMGFLNIVLMVLSTIVLFWIGQPFVKGVARFLQYRVASMDTLIGVGTLTAYIYSAIVVLFPEIKLFIQVPEYVYFDVVIVVIGFVSFGKYLEIKSKQKTGEAIKKLIGLQAKTALVIRDGKEIEISVNDVLIGDVIVVKPGSKIPVDGKIIEGRTSIDESMITGESIPVDKFVGDVVIGSTINKQGSIKIEATKIGSDTMLSQIIKMVEQAQGSKAPIQALVDKISGVFVPIVLAISFISLIFWIVIGTPLLGQSSAISYGILSFVGVLVIACPCALGLATPTAIIVGVGKGAENGILVKNAESLEILNKANVVVFDKTGTITKGSPEVVDVVSLDSAYHEDDILRYAGSIEKLSEHPLAEAIVLGATSKNVSLLSAKDFVSLEGIGVFGMVDNKNIYIHKPEMSEVDERIRGFQQQGKTIVIVEIDKKKAGLISLSDSVKAEAKDIVESLHKQGLRVVMLTGDSHLAGEYIAKQVGIDDVIAEVLPNEKAEKIKEIQLSGNVVVMVGDGVNDAPALAQADIGVAMSTGTDVAIGSAGITLLHGDISKLVKAIKLSKMTVRGIKQNLFWAFVYNVIGIPLAAGLFYPIFGWLLSPVFAGFAMAMSSVSVVYNSLRIKNKKL